MKKEKEKYQFCHTLMTRCVREKEADFRSRMEAARAAIQAQVDADHAETISKAKALLDENRVILEEKVKAANEGGVEDADSLIPIGAVYNYWERERTAYFGMKPKHGGWVTKKVAVAFLYHHGLDLSVTEHRQPELGDTILIIQKGNGQLGKMFVRVFPVREIDLGNGISGQQPKRSIGFGDGGNWLPHGVNPNNGSEP